MSPRISVYITSYNQKEYLVEAIDSVLNQTLKPFEIIIVDDCSTDGSREVIAGYALRYPDLVNPIYHTRNQGVAQARIDALQMVTGDYVTYVDGDDRYLPTKLEKEARLLQENANDLGMSYENQELSRTYLFRAGMKARFYLTILWYLTRKYRSRSRHPANDFTS